jgi:hypothetical protein
MRTERILAIVSLAAYAMKLLHWPGSSVLLIMSLSALSIIYWPCAFYFFSEKKLANQNLALTIPSGILFSTIIIYILFRLQYWKMANLMPIGIVGTLVVFTFSYTLRKKAASDELKLYYKRMLRRTIVMFSLSVLFLFTTPYILLLIQCRDAQEAHLREVYYSNTNNSENKKQLDDYIHKRDSLAIYENIKN